MSTGTQRVDYLIIGAGIAGMTLKHFLRNDRTVIVDPNPGAYKVGESIIPETFHHPEMQTLLEHIRALPSFSPKNGTTFVSKRSAASFPIPIHGLEFSMHVARSELEQLMLNHWDIPVSRERVRQIDLNTRTVCTDQNTYVVEKQILDCSGPAMVVARALDQVIEVRPAFATWTYFDITHNDASKFWTHIQDTGRSYLRYDAVQGRVLDGAEEDGWDPSHSTILTQIADGLWSWQIPLHQKTLLSFGLVSRDAKISADTLYEVAEQTSSPHYTLRRRNADRSSPHNRVHTYNRFAKRAKTPATMDYILVSDACSFGDPVYSVGTGVAVNKAIEAAALLNEGDWTADTCARWCADYEKMMGRAYDAFDNWYSGAVLTDDSAAREVQDNFLLGNAFQVGIATQYSNVLVDASSRAPEARDTHQSRFHIAQDSDDLTRTVKALLGLSANAVLAGWTYAGAASIEVGVQHRWQREGLPELIVNTLFSPDITQYYRRVGTITLSFMNLWDRPYPLDDRGRALFDALETAIADRLDDWMALKS